MKRIHVFAIIGIILSILILGLIFFPHLFYDRFIWKYFWGPIKADALGHPVERNGILASEGYTFISEIVYGILLVIALMGIYKLLKFLQIRVDFPFFLAFFPYILLGPITRVLEDSGLYSPPFQYLFISPLIYIQLGIYSFGFLIFGVYLERLGSNKSDILKKFSMVLIATNILYLFIYFLWRDYFAHFVSPFLIAFFSGICLFFIAYQLKKENFDHNSVLFSSGLFFLLPSIVGLWLTGNGWGIGENRISTLPIVLGLSVGITLAIFFLAKFFNKIGFRSIAPFAIGMNCSLIFAHLLDGWSSYIAVHKLGYMEKHPLPSFIMDSFGEIAYPILKLGMILAIIYFLDVVFKKDLEREPILPGLLKIFIFILGFAPGMRDLLRIVMGI